jgi:hypothetical protein
MLVNVSGCSTSSTLKLVSIICASNSSALIAELRHEVDHAAQRGRMLRVQHTLSKTLCSYPHNPKRHSKRSCKTQFLLSESSRMSAIYRQGVLNIAATGFSDGKQELFSKRYHTILIPIHVDFSGYNSTKIKRTKALPMKIRTAFQVSFSLAALDFGLCSQTSDLSEGANPAANT